MWTLACNSAHTVECTFGSAAGTVDPKVDLYSGTQVASPLLRGVARFVLRQDTVIRIVAAKVLNDKISANIRDIDPCSRRIVRRLSFADFCPAYRNGNRVSIGTDAARNTVDRLVFVRPSVRYGRRAWRRIVPV